MKLKLNIKFYGVATTLEIKTVSMEKFWKFRNNMYANIFQRCEFKHKWERSCQASEFLSTICINLKQNFIFAILSWNKVETGTKLSPFWGFELLLA